MLFTPCKVNFDGTSALELAPVCGMKREDAENYARIAWADDAGVMEDESGHVEWVGDDLPADGPVSYRWTIRKWGSA